MYRKILLPVDLTDKYGQALDAAAELAGQSGGEVILLHVVEVIAGLSMDEERGFYDRLEKTARSHLRRLGDRLGQRKVTWRAEVLYGHRGPEVVRYARDAGTELIVLTSPRIDPNNLAAGWGSLSYKLSLVAPCPVLLVK
jgi:nucleotide-binding universal stress UspA family protein